MLHRHLNHEEYTLAAIDDIIGRGQRQDWSDLRRAALADRAIMQKVLRIATARVDDPYDGRRHHIWRRYAARHLKDEGL